MFNFIEKFLRVTQWSEKDEKNRCWYQNASLINLSLCTRLTFSYM